MKTLTVKSATVLTGRGPDRISLELDAPASFAIYPGCSATIEATKGTGATWVRTVLGIEPEVIETGN